MKSSPISLARTGSVSSTTETLNNTNGKLLMADRPTGSAGPELDCGSALLRGSAVCCGRARRRLGVCARRPSSRPCSGCGRRWSISAARRPSPAPAGQTAGADASRRVNGMGTGVVIDPRGYIVTNHHVVDGVHEIQVTLADGERYVAKLVARDMETDLAIIKIDAAESAARHAHRHLLRPDAGRNGDRGGQRLRLRAHGHARHRQRLAPRGPGQRRPVLRRPDPDRRQHQSGQLGRAAVEHRRRDDRHQRGGPGRRQGIGFAIPVDKVMAVAAALLASCNVNKAWIGVTSSNERRQPQQGMVVGAVEANSPAAEAGLAAGDVITAVGDAEIQRPLDFQRAMLDRKPGQQVQLAVRRAGDSLALSLTLGDVAGNGRRPIAQPAWDLLGVELKPIPPEEFRKNHQTRYRGGLLVTAVRPDSPAASQGIVPGDVLVGMHIWETVSLENVAYILKRPDFANLSPVKFFILRGDETLYGYWALNSAEGKGRAGRVRGIEEPIADVVSSISSTGDKPPRSRSSESATPGLSLPPAKLCLQPRRDLFDPTCGVLAQALAAQMDASAILLAEFPLQRVGVGAFQSDAGIPQRFLGGANVGRGLVARHVIARLGDEPRGVPTDLAARVVDELFEILPVEIARQRATGIFLIRVGLALMPQARPGSRAARVASFARRSIGKDSALALPLAARRAAGRKPVTVGGLGNVAPLGSHSRTLVPPTPQATIPTGTLNRSAMASPNGGTKLPAAAAGAGLRIVGRLPSRPVEGGHQAGLRVLLFLAIIGRVRLSGDQRTLRPRRRAAPRPSPRPLPGSSSPVARQAYHPPAGTLSSARETCRHPSVEVHRPANHRQFATSSLSAPRGTRSGDADAASRSPIAAGQPDNRAVRRAATPRRWGTSKGRRLGNSAAAASSGPALNKAATTKTKNFSL